MKAYLDSIVGLPWRLHKVYRACHITTSCLQLLHIHHILLTPHSACIVDQLQRAVERQEYSEAAHLVEAVQQLSLHFQSFAQIPKVAELGGRVSTLQKSLQMNVMREFELLGTGEESTNPLLLERLKACCLVTDALGYKARLSVCVSVPAARPK